jgi:hypothetical protein
LWGDPGVTELQIIKDNSIALANTGVTAATTGQAIMTLQHVGLLRRLRVRLNIPFTVTGFTTGPTKDINGPWDLINLLRFDVNGIAPLYVVSGWGAYLISLLSTPFATVDVDTSPIVSDANAFTDVYAFPAIAGAGSFTATGHLDLPFSVDISLPGQQLNLPTELGLWLLQNQTVDMVMTVNFNALQGANPGVQPYQGGTGSTYAYSGATIDVEREFYRIPSDPQNMPVLAWAHQWVETFVPFTGTALDLPIARAGIVLRAIAYVFDGATSDGVLAAKVLQMTYVYGANETPFLVDPGFMRARQLRDYGKLLPKGTFVFDWYKWTGTPGQLVGSFKLTYNTEAIVNQRVHFDFTSSMASGSYVRFLVERLIPIVANRTASPVATSGAPVGAQQAPVQTGR